MSATPIAIPESEPYRLLTEHKTRFILEVHKGYQVSGFVLIDQAGNRCIVEHSAVRWLSKGQMWQLMHDVNHVDRPAPELSEVDSEGGLTD